MNLDYTCTYCGGRHRMLTACPEEEADIQAEARVEAARADADAEAQARAEFEANQDRR